MPAHLTVAASLGPVAWMRSVIGIRFDSDRHNALRLAEQLGNSPEETLDRFRRVQDSTTATWGPKNAWLGEVVIHGQDIRRPLELPSRTPHRPLSGWPGSSRVPSSPSCRDRGSEDCGSKQLTPISRLGSGPWCKGRSCRC